MGIKYIVNALLLVLMISCIEEDIENFQKNELLLSGNDWHLVSFEPNEGVPNYAMDADFPLDRAIAATVPGDIHWDLMRAGELPDIYIGSNAQKTYDLPLKEWWYRKSFTVGKEWSEKHVRIQFEGVDYATKVWFNGEYLGSHKGQFTPFEFNVTDKVKIDQENTLTLLIESAPENIVHKLFELPRGQWQRQYAQDEVTNTLDYWKSRTMTGWDWGTPLWSMGIWKDVKLIGSTDLFLDDLLIYPQIETPYDTAIVNTTIHVNSEMFNGDEIVLEYKAECITANAPGSSATHLLKPTKENSKGVEFSFPLSSPALWWPNGYGEQNLYSLTVTAKHKENGEILDQIKRNFGIREIQLLQNPKADDYQKMMWFSHRPTASGVREIPEDSKPEFLVQINGRPIFLHGGNWLPSDLLYGRPGKEKYKHLIRMATLANYNVFRVWGGGIIEKQTFYDLCDQYGILVWQEIPNGGSIPLETDKSLATTNEQQRKIMPQLINHPSIFRYGFGNELYMTRDNSKQVAQFEDICKEMDPMRQVVGPSPIVEYQRHGPHWFNIPNEYDLYNTGYPLTAGPDNPVEWTEYGASGASSLQTLKRILPDTELWPLPYNDSVMKWHNSTGAYTQTDWLKPEIYKSLFGELPNLETEIKASQFVQSEGLRYANQSHRRKKWHRSGSYMWTFNEPWPNVAHGSIVEYYGLPKMAYYYVGKSYSQIDVSAEYKNISLHPNDTLNLPVFVTNARSEQIDKVELVTKIMDLEGNLYYEESKMVLINANSAHRIDTLNFHVPKKANNNVLLVRFDLFDEHKTNLSSQTYTFGISSATVNKVPDKEYLRPMLYAPKTDIQLSVNYHQNKKMGNDEMACYYAKVKNTSNVPALFVQFISPYKPQEVYFGDNYFILLPGEEKMIDIMVSQDMKGKFRTTDISLEAWNSN
ncbi:MULTISPECIES: glycosyl hydrolase 2 galactose-binding domain-containing protein [unclassified Arenibacter]|uniref:glycoside hydrolase family 2 protein n=1 Tax=unclassified Arenibacter TaxID=2615047 RepID=UPI0015F2A1F4|nr:MULTISPECIES: sugar-binding domain-containing protein [unclassified Arenibacter]